MEGDPLLWPHIPCCNEPSQQDSDPRVRGLNMGSILGSPRTACPSQHCQPTICLPVHPSTCPGHVAHLSMAPGSPMSQHGPSSPFLLPSVKGALPGADIVFLPTDDADSHFHERDRHQRCGARYS